MIRWIASTLLLLASSTGTAVACWFYPYGDDIRYHLLDAEAFGFRDMRGFSFSYSNYVPPYYGEAEEPASYDPDSNLDQWAARCKGQVPRDSLYHAVYELSYYDLQEHPESSLMIRQLQHQGDTAAIHYLAFAKSCEYFNVTYVDPWEKHEQDTPMFRRRIQSALSRAAAQQDGELRQRYAFLAMRMSYYLTGGKETGAIWKQFFRGSRLRKGIYYWALYFKALSETDPALENYELSQVFEHAPEKRYRVAELFLYKIPVSAVLGKTGKAKERSTIALIYGLDNPGKALGQIALANRYAPGSRQVEFLLLRELSKLEDWIYTPSYAYFAPSVGHGRREEQSDKTFLKNVPADRQYAEELLQLVRATPRTRRTDPALWQIAEAYLLAMTERYSEAMVALNKAERLPGYRGRTERQAAMLRTLWTIRTAPANRIGIPRFAQVLIMDAHRQKEYHFLFAAGRELEGRGATTEAALLFSRINEPSVDWSGEGSDVFWRTRKQQQTLYYGDYYTDYFFYLDAAYRPAQVAALLQDIASHDATDSFQRWMYARVSTEKDRLGDLLGTMYIRCNDLKRALSAFSQVPDTLYTSASYPYQQYLEANPFYANFYSGHQHNKADTVRYTKGEITASLIDHLQQAEDKSRSDRALHYFLAANCYLNMTYYGNSWMMRRYSWSSSSEPDKLEDEYEFWHAGLAKHYYLRAKATATNPMFAALCLRMVARCEGFKDPEAQTNRYFRQLRREYPDYAEQLISNCLSFDRYYAQSNAH